jgi:hypothetical protein
MVYDCESWKDRFGSHNLGRPGACIHYLLPPHKTYV